MPEVICNTSPIQYLHQLRLLHILPALASRVIVPPSVVDELAEGRAFGIDLPDLNGLNWVEVHRPVSERAVPLVTNLGPGETEVLMLALEMREALVVVDDAVASLLDQLQALRFRLAPHTRAAVLKLSGEGDKI